MKLVKNTAEYSIYRRGDDRYAVTDASKKPVNGDEKARILLAEELIKKPLSARPVVEAPAQEASAVAADAATEDDK